jgi:hypothetical protein
MQSKIIILFSILILTGCNQKSKESSQEATAGGESKFESFGAATDSIGAFPVADVIMQLKTNDSIVCKVSGFVTGVCQTKGCWMVLSNDPSDTTGIFVKFKDYGFFMPMDLAGSKIIANGYAYKEVTSVDELRHYAEDEGKSEEEIATILEPAEEMKFMADGVIVIDRKHNGQ